MYQSLEAAVFSQSNHLRHFQSAFPNSALCLFFFNNNKSARFAGLKSKSFLSLSLSLSLSAARHKSLFVDNPERFAALHTRRPIHTHAVYLPRKNNVKRLLRESKLTSKTRRKLKKMDHFGRCLEIVFVSLYLIPLVILELSSPVYQGLFYENINHFECSDRFRCLDFLSH